MARKKVVIAVGGTGGHLFPAQRFGEDLQEQIEVDLLFAGSGLKDNRYFKRENFRFFDVSSSTLFRKKRVLAVFSLLRGVLQSIKLLIKEKPDLVVGFGSFHAFPLLMAAHLLRIPLALFESNVIPGKVIRLFSNKAALTAIYLKGAKEHLKGNVIQVQNPVLKNEGRGERCCKESRQSLGLDPDTKTLLVFGGSQGSSKINESVVEMLSHLREKNLSFQLIHLTGSEEMAEKSRKVCTSLGICCYTCPYEKEMARVWKSSDLVICRSGAMTIGEIVHYEVPPILIPYPFASDHHQARNADFLKEAVGGVIHLPERELTKERLSEAVISSLEQGVLSFSNELHRFKEQERKRPHLSSLVVELLQTR